MSVPSSPEDNPGTSCSTDLHVLGETRDRSEVRGSGVGESFQATSTRDTDFDDDFRPMTDSDWRERGAKEPDLSSSAKDDGAVEMNE